MSRKESINDVKKLLESNGYTIFKERKSVKRCIEIQTEKDGIFWQFSVMALSPNNAGVYFGSTNSIEWWEGVQKQDSNHRFSFVIVRQDIKEGPDRIVFLAPEDVLRFTTIPSIKFNFNIASEVLSSGDYHAVPQKYTTEQILNIIELSQAAKPL